MFRTFQPTHELLKNYVHRFFIVDTSSTTQTYETVFPYSYFTIGFHLDSPYIIKYSDNQDEKVVYSGFSPIDEKATLVKPLKKHTLTVGANLFAYSLPVFTKFPVQEIAAGMEVEAIFGKDALTVHEKLYKAKSNEDKITLLESYLVSKLLYPENTIIEFVVKRLIATSGDTNIAALAHKTGLSDRILRIYFEKNVGCSIKTLAKIIRFEHALQPKLIVDDTLTERALASGYYDQSHYIRDFKHLTGLNPKAFFKHRQDFRFVQF